jgi:cytochrome c556
MLKGEHKWEGTIMRAVTILLTLGLVSVAAAAQAPAPARRVPAAAKPAVKPAGSLAQVMRGVYFPNSNIIFDVQQNDPAAAIKKSEGGASATDTYAGLYSGWDRVENAAVALTDGVDLILTPGRLCQNGKPVPTRNADFQRFAQEMRKAGFAVLTAAHTKNQEKVSDATSDLTDACSGCHEVYRDTGPADSAARCTAPPK